MIDSLQLRLNLLLILGLAIGSAAAVHGQQLDLARLVHPEVAERLSLTDQQRAQFQELLAERTQALAAAPDASVRAELNQSFDDRAREVLSDEQWERLIADRPTQKLMFQFREMKWDQVLSWFAGQQDLTLVMDRTPPGTFTYSDTRAYSPSQAIDLLNSVLMTRGYTLVRREKMLLVMELSDSLPLELLPRVTLEQLPERGRFELVSVMFALDGRPVDTVLAEIKPYLSSYGRALPLARGSQVLVVDTAGKMLTINELIAGVPIPKSPDRPSPPPGPVFAAYSIGTLDPGTTLAFVRQLIPSENITVDPNTGVLSAFVVPAQQTAIKSAIDSMLESRAQLPQSRSVAFALGGLGADDFRSQVLGLAPSAKVLVAGDRGLVVASQADQSVIESSLAALEVFPVDADLNLRILEVPPAKAAAFETALRSFFRNSQFATNAESGTIVIRGPSADLRSAEEIINIWTRAAQSQQLQPHSIALERQANAEWLATVQRIVPNAQLWLADEGRQLLMLADAADIQAVTGVLNQLQSMLPEQTPRRLKIYQLSPQQLQRRATLDSLAGELADASIAQGGSPAELLVWASDEQHTALAELLARLDQPLPSAEPTSARVYPLAIQDTSTVMDLLTTDFPKARLSLSQDGAELTVLATNDLQEEIRRRIEQLNAELPQRIEKVLIAYPVAASAATSLQQALAAAYPTVTVQMDSERDRLLVWAQPSEHQKLADLVRVIGEQPSVARQKVVAVYPVVHAQPAAIKTLLDQLNSGATIVADDKLKQLMITGTLEQQATLRATISQIDSGTPASAAPLLRGYDVKSFAATQILPTLQALWPTMQLSADTVANRIIASGSAEELQQLGAAIEQLLEAPGGKPQVIKSYAVPHGELSTLPAILTQIAPQAIISSDATSRTITALASEELHDRIRLAIEQVAQAAMSAKQSASYRVRPSQLPAIQTALLTLFPGIGVAVDSTVGQLVVVASETVQAQVADVVELLTSGPEGSERSLQAFPLDPDQIDASGFYTSLVELIPNQVKVQLTARMDALLAIGTEQELQAVAQQVEQLKQRFPLQPTLLARTYTLQHGNVSSAAALLTSVVPKATVVPEPTSRTLVVKATEQDQALVVEFLSKFDVPPLARTYLVKPSQLTAVLTALRTLFPATSLSSDPLTGQVVVVDSQSVHQRVAEVIELIVSGPNAGQQTVEVFELPPGLAESTSFLRSLQTLVAPQIYLEPNPQTHSLLAIGSPDELSEVARQVKLLVDNLPIPDQPVAAVYSLKHATTAAAVAVLQPLVPRATLAQDATSRTIAATARPEDQEKIRQLIKMLDQPKQTDQYTKVYRLKRGSGRALAYVLSELMSDARLFGDRDSGSLLATATEEQHERIQAIVEAYSGAGLEQETRVFSLGRGDSRSLQSAVQELNSEIRVTSDRVSNSLIVTASPEELEQVAEIVSQVEGSALGALVTAFYPVDNSNPATLASALQVNFPRATVAADTVGGGVFVTASNQEQQEITALVEQLNAQPTRLPSLKSFVIQHLPVASVARSLTEAYGRRSTASVTFSEETRSVFVVGTREELQVADQLIQLLDLPASQIRPRQFQVFPLEAVDGRTVMEALETAFRDDPERVEIRHDLSSGRLYLYGLPEQLARAQQLLQSLSPAPRSLQVIPLGTLDAYVAREAIDALFTDLPYSLSPLVTIDQDQQQLLIKASEEQLGQIRSLLAQMGAPGSQTGAVDRQPPWGGSSRIRVIQVQRNSQQMLDELRRIWPALRDNPLRVIDPATSDPDDDSTRPATAPTAPVDAQSRRLAESPERPRLVSQAGDSSETVAATGDSAAESTATASSAIDSVADQPPVVIVVGKDRWTVASDDLAALEQLDRILELLRSPRLEPLISTGSYSLYLLQHASATEIQTTLTELFRPADFRSQRASSSLAEAFRRVKVVADARTNALIVSGGANDRRLIEQLLGVLDSSELMGSLQQVVPTTLALRSATAQQVLTVLRDIYRSQIATSVTRRPIPIPEGVSTEVATLLQQLNAQAASPLLTITADETTNSLILRAPPELTMEIREFVQALDLQTANTPSRRVELIRLESTNTRNIEQALRRLLSR